MSEPLTVLVCVRFLRRSGLQLAACSGCKHYLYIYLIKILYPIDSIDKED
jgi:hypothetical protein